MPYVPYSQIKILKEVARGGYGIVYQAIWFKNGKEHVVAIKKFLKSRDFKKYFLNELRSYHECCHCGCIIECYGFTKDPKTNDYSLILSYAQGGSLHDYLQRNFARIMWKEKVEILFQISIGLSNIHDANFIHRDLHSGNILKVSADKQCCKTNNKPCKQWKIGDLGLSQNADIPLLNNEIYGTIPYVAPEVFKHSRYFKASDVYSFGMIMWELITGRKPFWDTRRRCVNLIIDICDGLRPPIITKAPIGYIELMEECWNPDPRNRPTAAEIHKRIKKILEYESSSPTEIMESPDIGPVKINQSNICKSRLLSYTIQSAKFWMNSGSQSIDLESGKRKFADNLIEDNNAQGIKRKKLVENGNNGKINLLCFARTQNRYLLINFIIIERNYDCK